MQFECGTRILRVIHGRDARATSNVGVRLAIFAILDLTRLLNRQSLLQHF
jgi:hypothetical protein